MPQCTMSCIVPYRRTLYHTILQSPILYHTIWDCVTFNHILLRNAKLCQTIVKCSKPYLNHTFGALPPYHLVSFHNSTLTVVILRFLVSLTNEVVRELIKDQRSKSASKQKKGLVYTIHSAVKIPGWFLFYTISRFKINIWKRKKPTLNNFKMSFRRKKVWSSDLKCSFVFHIFSNFHSIIWVLSL